MLQIKKILFPTDFSDCANQALPYARYFAAQHGAEVHILHAFVLLQMDRRGDDNRWRQYHVW